MSIADTSAILWAVPAIVEDGDGKGMNCELANLSEGGVAVRRCVPPRNRPEAKVQFALPGQHDSLKLGAEVCWYDQKGRAGLRFLASKAQASNGAVQDWLAARLEEKLPESVARQFQKAE